MEIIHLLIHLLTLVSLFMIAFSTLLWDFEIPDNPSIVYSYNRFSEIEENCESILSLASELKPDDDRGNRIKNELSFQNGDWDQQSNGAPFLPFDDSDLQRNDQGAPSLVKLVSFWVMDVDPVCRSKNTVSVSGILNIGITRDHPFAYRPYEWSPKFKMVPGSSTLTVLFEGVYIESKENGGERLMCLMGNATVPTRNHVHPELLREFGNQHKYQPSLVNDDRIMMVLHYPKSFSLTTRGISGEMKSLHEKSNLKNFDEVQISSLLGEHSNYQYGAEELLKACSPYPYKDDMVDEDIEMSVGDDFCHMLQHFVINEIFDLVPNWGSFYVDNNGSHLGPFILGKEMKSGGGCFENLKLLIQHLRCEPGIDLVRTRKVFAVFRVFCYRSWKDRYLSKERTGLSGTTISAEGIWRSSEGQLCMIGCLGLEGASSDECNTRICLYLPRTFSLKQRSIMFGTIASTNGSSVSLLFEKVKHPNDIIRVHQFIGNSKWAYKYSKAMLVNTFPRLKSSSMLRAILRKLQLQYPAFNRSDLASLSRLSDDLSFQVYSTPDSIYSAEAHKTIIEIQILSIGSVFGKDLYRRRWNIEQQIEKSSYSDSEIIEISGQLTLTSQHFKNISLSFEGLYDQILGKMHLVGCRDIRYFPNISKMGTRLEGGMDCQFEVIVEYPPENARWLMNPMIKISFSSKRSEVDPLHFSQFSLKPNPVSYIKKSKDIIFRKTFEGILRLLMLTLSILSTNSQLHCSKNAVPCGEVSLVMLAIQAVGYCIPLITGSEILFRWKVLQSNTYRSYNFNKFQRFDVLDSMTKILVLVALFVTVRLSQIVLESCIKEKGRIHREKKILLITLVVHVTGFLLTKFSTTSACETLPIPKRYFYVKGNTRKLLKWLIEIDDYAGLVQDFLLLPQIIHNTLLKAKGKPLRTSYYVGFTTLRVVLHAYDYIRDPLPDKDYNYSDVHDNLNTSLGLYSKIKDISTAAIVIILAVILHIQQQYDYGKPSQRVKPKEK